MNATLRRGLLAASLLYALPVLADDATNPDVQDAKNRADIANANATATFAMQNAQNDATQKQLTAQKAQIDNLQAALKGIDADKVKIDKPTAPALNAHINHLLATQLTAWSQESDSPVKKLQGNKGPLLLNAGSIVPSLAMYNATAAQLSLHADAIKTASDSLAALVSGARPSANKGFSTEAFVGALPAISGITALGNLALSYAAALHTQVAFTTTPVTAAQKMVQAQVLGQLAANNIAVIDADSFYDDCAAASALGGTPACTSPLLNAASSLRAAILAGHRQLDAAQTSISPAPTKKGADDPDAARREAAINLGKALDAASKDLQADFTSSGTAPAPITAARRGEHLAGLLANPDTRVLTITVISSDADTAARDGLFWGYRLDESATTTVSWTLTDAIGTVKSGGWKELFTDWQRERLSRHW